jgi:hypothetical protein
MNDELQDLREQLEALNPGGRMDWDGTLLSLTSVIEIQPLGRGGEVDFRIYDQPHAAGFIVERRPELY